MKTSPLFFLIIYLSTICTFSSCTRNSTDVWEDTKSASRHMKRGVKAIGGKHGDSRQIRSRSDFDCIEDNDCCPEGAFQDLDYQEGYPQDGYRAAGNDFIPIDDPSNELYSADMVTSPARETPGENGSSIPGIQAFRDPSTIPQLAPIFKPIYFEYDSSLVKGQQSLQTIHAIVDFLRYHPNMYIFVEGHTDERGPQAYNLALGSRRSNAVRNLLISEGVDSDHLFTISHGKERPVILERHEEGWAKNRRVEFKIYER